MNEHEPACDCWLCRDGVSDALVERIKNAKPLGTAMSAEEALAQLQSIGKDDPAHWEMQSC